MVEPTAGDFEAGNVEGDESGVEGGDGGAAPGGDIAGVGVLVVAPGSGSKEFEGVGEAAVGDGEGLDGVAGDEFFDDVFADGKFPVDALGGGGGEVDVVDGVAADFQAVVDKELELGFGPVGFAKDFGVVGGVVAEDKEGGFGGPVGAVLGVEVEDDAYGAVGVDVDLFLAGGGGEEAELADIGVVEGEDDGFFAGGDVAEALNEVDEVDGVVAGLVEALEVGAEVVGGALVALFGVADAVVFEDHDFAHFVGVDAYWQPGGRGRGQGGIGGGRGLAGALAFAQVELGGGGDGDEGDGGSGVGAGGKVVEEEAGEEDEAQE